MSADETIHQISTALRRIGVRRGGILLVHSSLSALGYVPGGPETVILGLLDALGAGDGTNAGTLLLPALSYQYTRWSGDPVPLFDVHKTPSNVGTIPEHFRTRPGTLRSINPTHSVCGVGPRADEILGEHHLDETPCGPHSPFRKLRDLGGQILMLGCGLRPNTSMHGVEEVAEAPYLFGEFYTYRIVDGDGRESLMRCRAHAFHGWEQRYDRIADLLAEGTELRIGQVLQAQVHLLTARAMWQRALAAMESDPFYFVERRQSR
jgi:aminoglycoside 3-N-acetyltransferase